MLWIFVIVILATSVYAFSVIGSHKAFLAVIQVHIARVEKEAATLGKAAEREAGARNDIQARIEADDQAIADLKHEITLTKTQLKSEQGREEQLEMDMYKNEFKRSKRTA